jgi:hypothetical protein
MIEIFRVVLQEEIKKIVGHEIGEMEYEIVRGTTGEERLRVLFSSPDGGREVVEIKNRYLVELARGYSNSIVSTTTAPLAIKYAIWLTKLLYNISAKEAVERLKKGLENVPPEKRLIQLSRLIAAFEVALNLTPKRAEDYLKTPIRWATVFSGKEPTNIEEGLDLYLERNGVPPEDIEDFVNLLYEM